MAERRREEILEVASTVFAKTGFRLTDVQVIADHVGVGKGTIYRYFPTKETLFLEAVDFQVRRLVEEIHAAVDAESDPLAQVKAALRTYLQILTTNPEAVELIMIERAEFPERDRPTFFAYREAGRELWEQRLERLMAEGRLRRLPAGTVIDAMENFGYGTIFGKYLSGRPDAVDPYTDSIIDLILHGMLPCPHDTAQPE